MSFRNKRTGAFQPFGGLFSTEKTSGLTRTAPAFVQNQTQSTMGMANQYRPVVVQPRVAPINQDQTAFFNTARNYAQQAMNREAPEIDTGALERQLGRTVDTSGIDSLIGRRADLGGVLGMVGQRVDLGGLEDAAAQSVSTDELGALMGQQNVARDIYQDFTTREVTPYLEAQVNDATDRALQNVSNLYAGSGRLGSAAFADAAARGVTAASAPILQQAAQTDAARQLQAAGMLGQAFNQDRAMDASLADRRAAIMSTNFGRQLQGQGILANLRQNAINRDLSANQFAAQMQNNAINRDAGLAQSSAGFASSDLSRDAQLANQLTNASRQQAMLAPTMQQMDMANMGLLAQIGAQQQAQQQAQYNAQLQYAQLLNQANQQQYNNMAMASQLGQPFIGQESYGDQGMFNTVAGLAATGIGAYMGMS